MTWQKAVSYVPLYIGCFRSKMTGRVATGLKKEKEEVESNNNETNNRSMTEANVFFGARQRYLLKHNNQHLH